MTNIFTLEQQEEEFSEKINIDELYEKKRQQSLHQLALFNKLLNRVYIKIKTVSRQKVDQQICWFLVPETIIGVPKYDQGACIAYLMEKLKTSGFNVRYVHPNLLIISWSHWFPSYVRDEIKKKTGLKINEYGEKMNEIETNDTLHIKPADPNEYLLKQPQPEKKTSKEYKPIRSYRPSGNLVYDDELLNKIENKFI
jgi:hypothetical protein